MSILDIIWKYKQGLSVGLLTTFQICSIAWFTGVLLGTVLGALSHNKRNIGLITRSLTFVFSSIPFIVILYWIHFPLQVSLGIVIDPFISVTVILVILNVVIVAEIWRSSLDSFDNQFHLAAKVCGLGHYQTLVNIKLPIVFRKALPNLLAAQVLILHMSLFSSFISVNELFRAAQRINSTIHKPIEIYTALAVFFFLLCLPVNLLAFFLHRKYTRDFSER